MTNPSYEKFVMRTMHTQRYARTLSDAFKDADYGTPIWRCETRSERESSVLVWLLGALTAGILIGLFVDIWIDLIVALTTS